MMAAMTSRERLLAAYRHDPVDRVPCSPRLWAWMLEYYGDAGPATYLRAAAEFDFDPHVVGGVFSHAVGLDAEADYALPAVRCRREAWQDGAFRVVRRTFQTPAGALTDVTRIPPADAPEYGIGPNPIRSEYLIKGPDDLPRVRYLLADADRADFTGFRGVETLIGERGLVLLEIRSALCHRAGDARGMENLMLDYYDDRAFFDATLALFQAEMMAEVHAALRAGVRHFMANWYYNSLSAGWSPAIWRGCFAPQLHELTAAVHQAGGTVNFYDDGKCMPLLETFAECGIDVLQTLTPPPVGDMDLAKAKRRIGDTVCLMGGIDLIYVLQQGTPALIEQTVRHALRAAGPTGFILGTSDSIRNGTPLENVTAYFRAAREYGFD